MLRMGTAWIGGHSVLPDPNMAHLGSGWTPQHLGQNNFNGSPKLWKEPLPSCFPSAICHAMEWKLVHLSDPLQHSPCIRGQRPRVPRGWGSLMVSFRVGLRRRIS